MKKIWENLELLNGWRPIDGFQPPQAYKADGYVNLRGSATGPHNEAIAYIGPEYAQKIMSPSLYGWGYFETWTIDEEGYLYFDGPNFPLDPSLL